ncbi:hypothetical protein ACNBDZ_004679, partial [Salmonella enterica subsp. enterica]
MMTSWSCTAVLIRDAGSSGVNLSRTIAGVMPWATCAAGLALKVSGGQIRVFGRGTPVSLMMAVSGRASD